MNDYDAVVLAGGGGLRVGGADKPALLVGGVSLLDRVLAACRGARATVVAGPRRPTARAVQWVREDPPGGGPLPALAAALAHVREDTVLVLAADLPFIGEETVRTLLEAATGNSASPAGTPDGTAALDGVAGPGDAAGPNGTTGPDGTSVFDGALLTDPGGRDQPLAAAYRTRALRRELAGITAEHGRLTGLPLRLLLRGMALRRIPDRAGAAFDCDTWGDVATAQARIGEHGGVLETWIAAVKTELGIDLEVDTSVLLDLARDAAHGVARPAAPLTTFLVGYAAGRAGGGAEAVAEAARKAQALALAWPEPAVEGGGGQRDEKESGT
jgi:GTP:adenosylcobinamide-phosphate guanylyltransferase